MTVLSGQEIMEHIKSGEIQIAPFEPCCLNPAGYDLRSVNSMIINSKEHQLAATVERIELGLKITATLHIRSSLAREGIVGSFAAVDPGFRGQLTLNLYNAGDKTAKIKEGEPIVQILFHKLGRASARGYSGVYQDSRGIVRSKRSQS